MKKIIILLCCMIIMHINAMMNPEISEKNKIKLTELPQEIKIMIVNDVILSPSLQTPEEVNDVMKSLARVNESWKKFITNSENTLSLIKGLSGRFGLSNMEITKKLSIKKARSRYTIQTAALCGWNKDNAPFIYDNLDRLFKDGLDLNFTYDDDCTLLLKPAFANEREHTGHAPCDLFYDGYFKVSKWLIDHGADINVITKDGKSASILIFSIFNKPLIELFLNHPKFKIHYQDNEGNTVLHCCFQQRLRYGHIYGDNFSLELHDNIYSVVEKLIGMGADPRLCNKRGKTSFDLAKETGYEPFLKILDSHYNS